MSDDNTTDDGSLTSRLANDPRLESMLTLDQSWVDRVLTIGILLLTILVLWETRKYDWAAQRVPVFVFGIILILSVVELLKQFGIIDWGEDGDDGSDIQKDIEERTSADDVEMPLAQRRVEMLGMIGWIVGLLLVVYFVGLLPGSLLFLLAFYLLEARVGILRTGIYSGAIFVFVWFVFEAMLKARLYPGVYEIGELFYVSGSLF